MKILLINEPFVEDFCRTQRWAAKTRGRVLRAPDWLAYATAVVEKDGFDAKLYDFPARGWGKDEYRKLISEEQPDIVVLDTSTPSIENDLQYAGLAKEVSNAKVVLVGPHASAVPAETLRMAKGSVDWIAAGEYDETISDIARNINNIKEVPGVWFMEDDKPQLTKQRPLIEPVDRLPFPAWHHLNLLDYFDGIKMHPYVDIVSGRGCVYRCNYCLWPQVMHGQKFRLRSPENVVDEMEYVMKLCPEVATGGEFFFEDDTFTTVRPHAMAICEEILRRNLKVQFSVNSRADANNLEMFKLMKRAGCRLILVGFESGVQDILNNIEKKATIEDAHKLMENAKKAGLVVHGCFVAGLPGETEQTLQQTIDFALGLGLHTVQFTGAVPYPGTRYYEWCKEQGLLRTQNWSDWMRNDEQTSVVSYPGLEAEKVYNYVDLALKRFYFRPSYLFKFLMSTRNKTDLYRKLRGFKNFVSYLFRAA